MKSTIKKNLHSIEVNVPVLIIKDGKHFVAYCPALNLSSYGKNAESAKQAFNENMEIFIEETIRKGTLEKYLLKQGWMIQQIPQAIYKPPMLPYDPHLLQRQAKMYSERISIPVN